MPDIYPDTLCATDSDIAIVADTIGVTVTYVVTDTVNATDSVKGVDSDATTVADSIGVPVAYVVPDTV